ncbi:hypothetical protein A3B46_00405 [Candidatus Roizmanbacteria bacterium RIFCSPLOWO2_01_FULL_39_19]|nr:MAG: hypothetical protein A3B46_00405 [Candidatus Roizmanbacteria bacterium RIFCSPLOWO2_01_FULL_39_19]
MKILITGGHITPALSVYDECKKRGINVVFVGRQFSYDKSTQTMEAKMLEERNIKLIHLDAGRLTRILNIQSVRHFLKIPKGYFQAVNILKKERPDAILSFGGYIGLPISIAGKLLSIPIFTHEQVMAPGLTNRLISQFASKVFVSFGESVKYFPKHKVILTGNPIRQAILKGKSKTLNIGNNKPVIFVTGGSLGAHELNRHVEAIMPKLTKKFLVVHQTGNVAEFHDFERLKKLENENYFVFDHLLDDDFGYMMRRADVIVSRSGANTVFELLALSKIAVLVPLPFSSFAEQEEHARLLEDSGVAKIFYQIHKSEELFETIQFVYNHRQEMEINFNSLSHYVHLDAAKRIVDELV